MARKRRQTPAQRRASIKNLKKARAALRRRRPYRNWSSVGPYRARRGKKRRGVKGHRRRTNPALMRRTPSGELMFLIKVRREGYALKVWVPRREIDRIRRQFPGSRLPHSNLTLNFYWEHPDVLGWPRWTHRVHPPVLLDAIVDQMKLAASIAKQMKIPDGAEIQNFADQPRRTNPAARLLDRWESRGGRYWVEIRAEGDGAYSVETDNSHGTFYSLEDARLAARDQVSYAPSKMRKVNRRTSNFASGMRYIHNLPPRARTTRRMANPRRARKRRR